MLVSSTTLLQATQSDVLGAIQSNVLFNASLWVNIALAGASILLFVSMGRDIQSPRARFIWVATLLVPLVSLSSYVGLASGLTVSFIQMPAGHPLAGEAVLTPWGRYLTWTLSTPMILLALGLLADTDLATLFTIITMDIAMCVTGLAAALLTSSYALRWVFFGISSAFFLAVLYVLLVEWPDDAVAAGTSDIFETLKLLTVVLWLGYPLFWALGTSGIAVLGPALTSWGYSALDIIAKYIFAYLLLSWVADNESVIANAGVSLGGTEND